MRPITAISVEHSPFVELRAHGLRIQLKLMSQVDQNTLILADFLGGYIASGNISRGDQAREVFVNTFSGFAQDEWRVRRDLSLNYGVRYDYEGALHNGNKDLSVLSTRRWRDCLPRCRNRFSLSAYLQDSVSPRVGFSFQPTQGGSTVIRGSVLGCSTIRLT